MSNPPVRAHLDELILRTRVLRDSRTYGFKDMGVAFGSFTVHPAAVATQRITRKPVTEGWLQPFRVSVTAVTRNALSTAKGAAKPRIAERNVMNNPTMMAAYRGSAPARPYRANSSRYMLCACP